MRHVAISTEQAELTNFTGLENLPSAPKLARHVATCDTQLRAAIYRKTYFRQRLRPRLRLPLVSLSTQYQITCSWTARFSPTSAPALCFNTTSHDTNRHPVPPDSAITINQRISKKDSVSFPQILTLRDAHEAVSRIDPALLSQHLTVSVEYCIKNQTMRLNRWEACH
jgi:hypothetical protein